VLVLDDNFRITVDSSRQNYQLEMLQPIIDKKTREVVRYEFGIIGYHGSSMKSVLHQYTKQSLINDNRLQKVNDILDRLNEIEKTIIKVVKAENFKLVAKDDK
jgi:hypothetical protein